MALKLEKVAASSLRVRSSFLKVIMVSDTTVFSLSYLVCNNNLEKKIIMKVKSE